MKSSYCTWFPDRVFGVDISLACYDHDAAYDTGDYGIKVKSDIRLGKEVYKLADRADKSWKKVAIKGISFLMSSAVLTVGNLFWLKTKLRLMKDGYNRIDK